MEDEFVSSHTVKNNGTQGKGSNNIKLFKYSGIAFEETLLTFLNKVVFGEDPPENWQKAIVLHWLKKGDVEDYNSDRIIGLLSSG
jgi:hypothetical protein